MNRQAVINAANATLSDVEPIKGTQLSVPLCTADIQDGARLLWWTWPMRMLKALEGRTVKTSSLKVGECSDPWIVDLVVDLDDMNEARAREILGDALNEEDGAILEGGYPYMAWRPHQKTITLDSDFTVEQLEAIAWWMRKHAKPK